MPTTTFLSSSRHTATRLTGVPDDGLEPARVFRTHELRTVGAVYRRIGANHSDVFVSAGADRAPAIGAMDESCGHDPAAGCGRKLAWASSRIRSASSRALLGIP